MFRGFIINPDRIVLTALVANCAAYLPYSLRINGMQIALPVPPHKLFAIWTSQGMFVVCDIAIITTKEVGYRCNGSNREQGSCTAERHLTSKT